MCFCSNTSAVFLLQWFECCLEFLCVVGGKFELYCWAFEILQRFLILQVFFALLSRVQLNFLVSRVRLMKTWPNSYKIQKLKIFVLCFALVIWYLTKVKDTSTWNVAIFTDSQPYFDERDFFCTLKDRYNVKQVRWVRFTTRTLSCTQSTENTVCFVNQILWKIPISIRYIEIFVSYK